MSLNEVFKDIALAYTAEAHKCNDVSFPNPGINDICVMLSSQYFHNTDLLSNADIVKFFFFVVLAEVVVLIGGQGG